MKFMKRKCEKIEFEITGYEKHKDGFAGIIINMHLSPSIENSETHSYLDNIKLYAAVLQPDVNNYVCIMDNDYDIIKIDDYKILKDIFNNEDDVIEYLSENVIRYASINNLPLFFQDVALTSATMSRMIYREICNGVYSECIDEPDDINDSYKLKWEISNNYLKLSNRYLEKTFITVNKDNVTEGKLISLLYEFWNEWNRIIPGKFDW